MNRIPPKPIDPDPYLWHAVLFMALVVAILPASLALASVLKPTDSFDAAAARLDLSREVLIQGRDTFRASCAVCHGAEGEGVARLGKPLRNSAFVQGHSDEQLLALITQGRPPSDPENTTGVLMPARAGNPTLSDVRLASVVSYLRMLQEPGVPPVSTEAWVRPAPSPGGPGAAVAGAGLIGHDSFISSCSACHGENAEGLPGLGKPLADSPFVASKSDAELLAFIKQGRPIWDPDNTTGVDMPPKGGNPALGDEELRQIVEYLRALHPGNGGQ